LNALKRAFVIPAAGGIAGGVVFFLMGVDHPYALMALALSTFVTLTIFREFYKGARARGSSLGENFFEALVNLTMRNTRRYGGYVVHFGIVLIFVGFSGQAFNTDVQEEVGIGETMSLNQYTLRVENLRSEDLPNYNTRQAIVGLYENGQKVAVMYPEQRFYFASEQQTTEPSIRSTLKEDLYVVFAGVSRDGSRVILQVYLNPLVMWVWIGGIVLGLGTMIAMLPNKRTAPSRPAKSADAEKTEDVQKVHV
jgi:cytochrome c-type biogenesis protein CcmF